MVLKIALDTTGCVHFRNPHGAGGLYYVFNAVMTHVACFVAAKLYSAYGLAPDNESRSTTGSNFTAANTTFPANGTAVDYARADFGQIGNFTLVGAIGTLSAVWVIAFVGLLLTMKREYVRTFVSMQTGCAFSRSHFLDHAGDDARRTLVFYTNQGHWRSIRDLVRQWVLSAYATWLLLSPAWLSDALRSLIPDDFLPAPVVQQRNAQTPDGPRRPT